MGAVLCHKNKNAFSHRNQPHLSLKSPKDSHTDAPSRINLKILKFCQDKDEKHQNILSQCHQMLQIYHQNFPQGQINYFNEQE